MTPRYGDSCRSTGPTTCRADRFDDQEEGLPTDDYARYVCAQMGPGHDLDNTIGNLVQQKKSYFISCWYLSPRSGPAGKRGLARRGLRGMSFLKRARSHPAVCHY